MDTYIDNYMEEEEISGGYIAVLYDTSVEIYDSSKSNLIVEYSSKSYKGKTDRPRGVITIHDKDEFKSNQVIFDRYLNSLPWTTRDTRPIKKYPERSHRGSLRKKRSKKKTKKKRSKKRKTKST